MSPNVENQFAGLETVESCIFGEKDLNKMEANDRMLRLAGDFGKYQFLLIFLFSIINIFSAWHYYSQTIISITPEHSCENNQNQNSTEGSIQTYWPTFANTDSLISLDIINNNLQNSTYQGENKSDTEYLHDYGFAGMVAELNWVCENNWKSILGQSLFFLGSVIGTLGFGILADIYGRLPMLVGSNLLAALGNTATSFVFGDNVAAFATCRFVSGMATDSNFVMMYIIVMEYLSPERRTLGLNLTIGIFYCLGTMSAPWIAVLCGDWRTFLRITSAPLTGIFIYWFLVPESAQWLLSIGKIDKAVDCFKRIAKCNNKTIDEKHVNDFKKLYIKTINQRSLLNDHKHKFTNETSNQSDNITQNVSKNHLNHLIKKNLIENKIIKENKVLTDVESLIVENNIHSNENVTNQCKTIETAVKNSTDDENILSEISFEEVDLNNFQKSYEDNSAFVHDSTDTASINTNDHNDFIVVNSEIKNDIGPSNRKSEYKKTDKNEKLCIEKAEAAKKANFFGLLKTPRLRRITIILLFKSMVLTLCYDAMSRNIENLGVHPFIIFTLSSSAILPACVILLLIQDKLGRKATAAGALLLSGIFTAGCGTLLASDIFKGSASVASAIALSVLGRLWVTVAYNSGAQYAAELIPTEVRGQGVAVAHVAGYGATFFSAYILYTGHLFPAFPSLILGILSILCGLSCLFLPETLGRHLPSTLQEGEDFGKGERALDFVLWSFSRKKNDSKIPK